MKQSLEDLKNLYVLRLLRPAMGINRVSKHQASKKGFKHEKRLSRGELFDLNKKLSQQYTETGEN